MAFYTTFPWQIVVSRGIWLNFNIVIDFGEVQEILGEYIITKKGNVGKDIFHIPKNLIERFDGDTVYFKITKDEAKQYKRDY